MNKHKISNMRIVSDDFALKHFMAFKPIALGTVEQMDEKDYEVIDNTETTIVTFAPMFNVDVKVVGERALRYISDYPLYASTSNISYETAIAVANAVSKDWEKELEENEADD